MFAERVIILPELINNGCNNVYAQVSGLTHILILGNAHRGEIYKSRIISRFCNNNY